MTKFDEKWENDGRKGRLYTVRSMGPGRGFGVLNVDNNTIVAHPFRSRAEAWEWLKTEKAG